MNSHKIFCMCLNSHHLENLKKLEYIPVGLGGENYDSEWLRDDTGDNISSKNPFYGEYTFYYWVWKNFLKDYPDNQWLGFCGYRYHWSQKSTTSSEEINKIVNKENFQDYVLKKIPTEWSDYDAILGEEIILKKYKISKIIKHAPKKFLKNPKFFLKKNQNIKLHFDVFHGEGIIDRAISFLDKKEKTDFERFVNQKNSFNRENLFFCKSKKLMNDYFNSVFSWLEKCENEFGFELEGYSLKRLYAFLAERYLSYWFQKYSKYRTWPIFFYDTNKNRIKIK